MAQQACSAVKACEMKSICRCACEGCTGAPLLEQDRRSLLPLLVTSCHFSATLLKARRLPGTSQKVRGCKVLISRLVVPSMHGTGCISITLPFRASTHSAGLCNCNEPRNSVHHRSLCSRGSSEGDGLCCGHNTESQVTQAPKGRLVVITRWTAFDERNRSTNVLLVVSPSSQRAPLSTAGGVS